MSGAEHEQLSEHGAHALAHVVTSHEDTRASHVGSFIGLAWNESKSTRMAGLETRKCAAAGGIA